MKKLVPAFLLAAALSLFATAAHAQSGTPQSPYVITTAPYTITKPGYYLLGKNLSSAQTSGHIIEIDASNVTLDFNGFYISGPVGNTNQQTYGVFANERSNLTIRNGTVAYCKYGVYLYGNGSAATNSVDQEIDHMRVTYCYNAGITVYRALASTVSNCKVSVFGYSGATGNTYGIQAVGVGTTVQDCVVSQGLANTSTGIFVDAGSFARRNTVSGCSYGIFGGKWQDNLSAGCAYPFSYGIDAGGNN